MAQVDLEMYAFPQPHGLPPLLIPDGTWFTGGRRRRVYREKVDGVTRDASSLEFPHVRREVLGLLRDLSDREYQRKAWAGPDAEDSFDNTITYLEMFQCLDGEAVKDIGSVYFDESEAAAIDRLAVTVHDLIKAVGKMGPDEAFLRHPLYDDVVQAAQEAHQAMERDRSARP